MSLCLHYAGFADTLQGDDDNGKVKTSAIFVVFGWNDV